MILWVVCDRARSKDLPAMQDLDKKPKSGPPLASVLVNNNIKKSGRVAENSEKMKLYIVGKKKKK